MTEQPERDRSPEGGAAEDATSYAPWTEDDARRARAEAEFVEERAEHVEEVEIIDPVGARTEHADVVEDIVLTTSDRDEASRDHVPSEDVFLVYDSHGNVHGGGRAGSGRAGASTPAGPGLAGLFGAGTPLGEATGLRLRPRKRWVALVAGVLGGAIGVQSFYTGRLFRGVFQAGLTISSWLLTLFTLGLLAPFAEVVTVLVWLWGGIEGVRYAIAKDGAYSVDALGGRLE